MKVRDVLLQAGTVGLLLGGAGHGQDVWAAHQNSVVAETPQTGRAGYIEPLISRLFAEPLFPTSPSSSPEKTALLEALEQFDAVGDPLNRQPFDAFLKRYPDSVWKSAVLGNMGLVSASAGRYTQALSDWREAWSAGNSAEEIQIRRFVDRIVGEQLQLLTRLGNQNAVSVLLAETEGRVLQGSASEGKTFAREGLWLMQNRPEIAFLCGPLALEQLLQDRQPGALIRLPPESLPATPEGYTLAALAVLAKEKGLDLTSVKRSEGQAVPVPSIVHWKSGHYAAIVAQDGERYLVRDPVMDQESWQSQATIDVESSGYFLAPAEKLAANGWRPIEGAEAEKIKGAGNTGNVNNGETPPCDGQATDCSCDGGGSGGGGPGNGDPAMLEARTQSLAVSLSLFDTPIAYAPSKGPAVPLTLNYSQREAYQPAAFTYFNVGPKWTLKSLSYIVDNPQSIGSNVKRYNAGGGTTIYGGYAAASGQFAATAKDMSTLVLTSTSPVTYERRLSDGSKEVYAQSDNQAAYPRRIFLSKIVDKQGQTLSFSYDSQLRLTTMLDADGRSTTLQYLHSNPLLVTGMTDPFGRQATIAYDGLGRLVSITDVAGFTSTVTYDGNSNFVNTLTTPYGTSKFSYGENGVRRWLEITDPKGATERVEFLNGAPGIPFSETKVPSGIDTFNSYINSRSTFYWDKTAHALAKGDYTRARIKHWYHDRNDTNTAVGVLESIKEPLESRVWYNYPGQSWAGANGTCDKPKAIARVLPDGSTQLTRMTYNDQGQMLTHTDPKGRVTTYEYASNGIDLLRVKQRTASGDEVQQEFTWNTQHLPLTIKDASGQVTSLTYNAAGKLLTLRNPLGEIASYQYDASGRLITELNAQGKVQNKYTYDSYDRLATKTDSEGYALKYSYDVLNRLVKTVYPDGTTREATWDKFDLASTKDRNGKVTRYTYDATRKLTAVTDPLNRTVQYGYQSNGLLSSLTDQKGNVTTWERDIQGRMVAKVYPDGTRSTQSYDSAGRLTELTDALGQIERRRYGIDDRLSGIEYANAQNPTPSIQLKDDAYFPRLASMTDGLGITQYTYVPSGAAGAGQIQKIDGPYNNDGIALGYDALGRLTSQTIGDKTETYSYDKLGRLVTHGTPLGSFSYAYLGQSSQVKNQKLGNGFSIDFLYEANQGDRRLLAIMPHARFGPGAPDHYYRNAPESLILAHGEWPGKLMHYRYDDAYRVIGASQRRGYGWGSEHHGHHHGWGHWEMGWENRWADDRDNDRRGQDHDRHDHHHDHQPEGYAYTYDASDNLTRVITPEESWSGAVNSNNQYTAAKGSNWQYDAVGNLIDDGKRIYTWDAAKRLIRVQEKSTAQKSEFAYDGLSRMTVRKEYASATATPNEVRYLWCGDKICQSRDGQDNVVSRYYTEGELQGSTALYYVKDHLGSITDVVSAQGKPLGQLDYGPYGEQEKARGRLTDFRYAGMLYHPNSGYYFTHYRVYDPETGRWLSRDPIGEVGGLNLYGYALGNPVIWSDPTGTYCIFSDGKVIKLTPTAITRKIVEREWETMVAVPVPSPSIPSPGVGFPWPGFELMYQVTRHQSGYIERLYNSLLGGIWRCYDDCGKMYFQGWGTNNGSDQWQRENNFEESFPGKTRRAGSPGPGDLPPISRPQR